MISVDAKKDISDAKKHFGKIIEEQLERIEMIKAQKNWIDYNKIKPIKIGIINGDGIGPCICEHAKNILQFLLKEEVKNKKIEFQTIEGLTIENRVKFNEAIPKNILKKIKKCHVILKGPTTTPKKGDSWPNIESANVAMRRELDLFANIRPIKVPDKNIDWIFFRENTEGAYILGSRGISINDNLSIDFKVTTEQGAERIIKLAFEYAKNNNRNKLTVVTKANIIKSTDGRFLKIAEKISRNYPEIEMDNWFVDIMAAKLIDPLRANQFEIIVLPNLYGDICTDEAAQIQGGVGTSGSANIGKYYAMFEPIHGSAPRMLKEGRVKYANPNSAIKAASMLLDHIGYHEKANKLNMALDICNEYEQKFKVTGRDTGSTSKEYAEYIMDTIKNPKLKEKWESYQKDRMT